MSELLRVDYGTKTILDLRHLKEQGHLNLEPGFQRQSVWTSVDRRKLIQSVFENVPVPSIFLYRREQEGKPIYDVIDGKQRLETVFMFSAVAGYQKKTFEVLHQFAEDDDSYWYSWTGLKRYGYAARFLDYKIPVVEVSGSTADIVDLFVRINSTGKALTSSEKRHARFYKSPFLREARRLAASNGKWLLEQQIVSSTAVARMKDVELVSELLASIAAGTLIHKKQAVDKAVGNVSVHKATLSKAAKEFTATLTCLRKVFPELRSTRFRHVAEFYTLFMVIWSLRQQNKVFSDKKSNQAAMQILRRFSDGVDAVREQQRLAHGAKEDQRLFADYLMLVQQSTDALTPRRRRGEMIEHLLGGLFERKDERRVFSAEQRRVLWNSEEKKSCAICGEPLGWNNFQIDHIKPHSRGGKTALSNAALTCVSCNASKGARRPTKRRSA